MAKSRQDWSKTAYDASQAAQDVARRYMDSSAPFGRIYLHAWTDMVHAGLGTAFSTQRSMIQVTQATVEANVQASRDILNQAADSLRVAQEATSKIVTASTDMVESMMPEMPESGS